METLAAHSSTPETTSAVAHSPAENIVSSTQQLDHIHPDFGKDNNDVNMNRPLEYGEDNASPTTASEETSFSNQSSYQKMTAMYSTLAQTLAESPKWSDDCHGRREKETKGKESPSSSNGRVSSSAAMISSPQELEKFNAAHQALLSLSQAPAAPTGYVTFDTGKENKEEPMDEGVGKPFMNNNSILSKALESNYTDSPKIPSHSPDAKSVSHQAGIASKELSDDIRSRVADMSDKKVNVESHDLIPHSTTHVPMETDFAKQSSITESEKPKEKIPKVSTPSSVSSKMATSMAANIVHPGFMFAGIPAIPYPAAPAFDPTFMAANYAMMQSYMSAYAPPLLPMKEIKDVRKSDISPSPSDKQPKQTAKPHIPDVTDKEVPESQPSPKVDKSSKKDLRTYKCKACPRIFCHLAKLVRHEKTHVQESPFRCGLFLKKSNVEGEKPFNCLMCTDRFSDQVSLQSHITDVHSSRGATPTMTAPVIDSSVREESYKCRYCTKVLRSSSELVSHEQEHMSMNVKAALQSKESHSPLNQETPVRKVEPQPKPSHRCKICGKGFDSSYMLERHKYLEKCNPSGASENQYPLQQRFEQPATEQEFACPICRKKYKCEKLLKSHVKFSHLEERPHVCSICSKAFKQKATLKQHEKLHAEEKPYVCNICSRGFVYPSRLKTHQQTCKPGEPAMC